MKKINFNSIKSKMIIGYGSMALLIVIVVLITLSQISGILEKGTDVLENKQPSRLYVDAYKSGIRNSNISFQNYLLSGSETTKQELNKIWNKEVKAAKDSLDSLVTNWSNPENIILYEKINRLANRIKNKQEEAINNASFSSGTTNIYISDYPNLAGDTIYGTNDLQTWIDGELSNQSSGGNQNAQLFSENVKPLSDEFDDLSSQLYVNLEQEALDIADEIYSARDRFLISELIIVLISIILCLILFRYARNQIKNSIDALQSEVKILSEGNIPETKAHTNDELDIILEEIHILSENLSNVKNFALEVGKGSFDSNISVFNNKGDIGTSLAEMRESLKNVSEEARVRNWTNKGTAEFGDILRKFNNNISELSDHVITFMVNYLEANQGSIFIVDDSDEDNPRLQLTATYAYDRKKFLEKTIEPGQGLVGQVYLEKQSIYLKELPKNYINITSGLGNATPKSIFIVPLIANEKVYGVIELGTFTEFNENERKFIEDVGENIASSVQSVKINERTNKLLAESQEMTEQMRSQEEEMRQNMEELQATQEEMERSQGESNERMQSIEKSGLAFIEFKPSGHIVSADRTFLNLMEYEMDELEGKHHQIFVSPEYAKSEEYKKFREDISNGKLVTGVFERYTKTGKKKYLKGAYSDVRNTNGEPVKVFKFIVDVTDIVEKSNELIKEKEELLKQLENINSDIEKSENRNIEDLKSYQEELRNTLLNKLKKTEQELKASLEKQKKDLGL
ncbi:GAF domain-containing protein [Marivirga arenosa]|uniref:GAF domain-containing protein n=1 Tax=Marivirga arenosa TaxID=3059076 RepID=A0AA51R7I6_9BACT|nr:GAF domain-containing protein [Marivirga sp. ABR2-2]WMN07672.1 GAF domain-containing protein [Marivirga sp. ABR2-2]